MKRKLLLILSGCLVVVLICSVVHFFTVRRMYGQSAFKPPITLPLDVEAVVNNYQINDESGERFLRFKGKRLIRRGQKFWGVRSTVSKRNFFEDVNGTYQFKKGTLKFAAKEASWGLTDASPIFLKGNVEITINGEEHRYGNNASIHLQTGIVELEGKLFPVMSSSSDT